MTDPNHPYIYEGQQSGERGPWMATFSGNPYYPLNPVPQEVSVVDIAASTAKICRYGGHALIHYSVAQHSLLVALILAEWGYGPHEQIAGLMHDAAEAYVGDMISQLKSLPSMEGYRDLEKRNLGVILEATVGAAGPELPQAVHEADRAALFMEYPVVIPPRGHALFNYVTPPARKIPEKLLPMVAERDWRLVAGDFVRHFISLSSAASRDTKPGSPRPRQGRLIRSSGESAGLRGGNDER